MNTPRIITPLIKLCVLAAIGLGLYALSLKGIPYRGEEEGKAVETEVAVQIGKISLTTLRHDVTTFSSTTGLILSWRSKDTMGTARTILT